MRKITAVRVEELHKRYRDRTTAVCVGDGYVQGDGIGATQTHPFNIDFDDKFAPELGQRFLVILEDIPALGPKQGMENPLETYINERREALDGAKKIENGRKFR